MNDRYNKVLQYNFSGIGCWLTIIALAMLLSAVGLGWIVNGFLILFLLILFTPVIAFFGLQWWLRRNFIQDNCPVCSYEFTGLKNSQFQCPNCGEPLQVEVGKFTRITPPGTIDVEAVDVQVQVSDSADEG
ncbi:MAG: hypothetical protein QNJ55_30185 [Xenococcus sp. MO_188.B8]|nr:hypothetical protein [Xenococcus sp. MO_188.B8]